MFRANPIGMPGVIRVEGFQSSLMVSEWGQDVLTCRVCSKCCSPWHRELLGLTKSEQGLVWGPPLEKLHLSHDTQARALQKWLDGFLCVNIWG